MACSLLTSVGAVTGLLPLELKHSWNTKSKREKHQKLPQQQRLDLNSAHTFNVPKSQVSDV